MSGGIGLTLPSSVKLYSTTLTGAAASIDYSGIPAGYSALQILLYAKMSDTATVVQVRMRFNGDSGANYYFETLAGSDAAASAFATSGATGGSMGLTAGNTTSNRQGVISTVIPGYDGAFQKGWVSSYGVVNTTFETGHVGGLWTNTAAITQVTLIDNSGGNFNTGTKMTLYGLL